MSNIIEARNVLSVKQLLMTNRVVVLDFYSEKCESCKKFSRDLVTIANGFQTVYFAKINADNQVFSDLINFYDVSQLPRVVVIADSFDNIEFDITGYRPSYLMNCLEKL